MTAAHTWRYAMSLVRQQQIVILSEPESRARDEGESKDLCIWEVIWPAK